MRPGHSRASPGNWRSRLLRNPESCGCRSPRVAGALSGSPPPLAQLSCPARLPDEMLADRRASFLATEWRGGGQVAAESQRICGSPGAMGRSQCPARATLGQVRPQPSALGFCLWLSSALEISIWREQSSPLCSLIKALHSYPTNPLPTMWFPLRCVFRKKIKTIRSDDLK